MAAAILNFPDFNCKFFANFGSKIYKRLTFLLNSAVNNLRNIQKKRYFF